ncbi:MAG: hypothetical protein V3V08_04975 [Nannocystaceae bacterium]
MIRLRWMWTMSSLVSALVLVGCEDEPVRRVRSTAPKLSSGMDIANADTKRKRGAGGADDAAQGVSPTRRSRPLTREHFDLSSRDPFMGHVAGDDSSQSEILEPESDGPQRPVVMSQYSFEELKLLAIVVAKGTIRARALFVASDAKSYTVKQGEYFSRAEVLLAAINHDYIEIEVVDEDLASGLNMQQGERRAIYLKTD